MTMTDRRQEEGWISNREEAERARDIRDKQARGEALTREERGMLGAVASRKATSQERREAEREGRGEEYREEHRTRSWMAGDDTRSPEVDEADRQRERDIRKKQAEGETLTREEAGFLGGIERAREAGKD